MSKIRKNNKRKRDEISQRTNYSAYLIAAIQEMDRLTKNENRLRNELVDISSVKESYFLYDDIGIDIGIEIDICNKLSTIIERKSELLNLIKSIHKINA